MLDRVLDSVIANIGKSLWQMKRVVTLDDRNFDDACRRLRNRLGHFAPDLVVAIPTGGRYVAASMFSDVPIVEISHRRPSTDRKKRYPLLKKLMKVAPYPVLDVIRILESYILQLKHCEIKNIDPKSIDQAAKEKIGQASNILIVDDAIDSGATVSAVVSTVKTLAPKAVVKTAVINVSTSTPMRQPDFTLYNNNTLIRFPWSMDMKTYRQPR